MPSPHSTNDHGHSTQASSLSSPGHAYRVARGDKEGLFTRFINRHFRHQGNLHRGMESLNQQLGLDGRRDVTPVAKDASVKVPTTKHARATMYAPDMDGQADPGEVVWLDIRARRGGGVQRRAVLIIGRNHHTLLTLLISANPEHEEHDNWIRIGSGPWDGAGHDSWVRMDKILEVPESQITRRGVAMPERRYDRITAILRNEYGWH